MKADQDFAAGYQWSKEEKDDRYVANLTLRIITQRVAFFYAKNPKFIAYRRKRILNTVWDGDQATLVSLQQAAGEMAQQVPMGGDRPDADGAAGPGSGHADPAGRGPGQAGGADPRQDRQDARTICSARTSTATPQDFKQMMKMTVRRACTTGVGYVKLGFERVMQKRPEIEAAHRRHLQPARRPWSGSRADIHDDETDENGPEAEQLRLLMKDLGKQADVVVREGLTFDYPQSSTPSSPTPRCCPCASSSAPTGWRRSTSSPPMT